MLTGIPASLLAGSHFTYFFFPLTLYLYYTLTYTHFIGVNSPLVVCWLEFGFSLVRIENCSIDYFVIGHLGIRNFTNR